MPNQATPVIAHGEWYMLRTVGNLGCVALAVSFSRFHSESPPDLLYRLNCHVDKQPVVRDLFLLDSGLPATAVEVSKSCHKSITKP